MFRTASMFVPRLCRSFSFQKLTSIDTPTLKISACGIATCLLDGGFLSLLQVSRETCSSASRDSSLNFGFSRQLLHLPHKRMSSQSSWHLHLDEQRDHLVAN